MPCIILTGHPKAGKTSVATALSERAKARNYDVIVVDESTACPDFPSMSACYETSYTEKKTRAALKAAWDRAISPKAGNDNNSHNDQRQQLVILDSLNYIKGFRYELHCMSKAAQQKHGVIWVLNNIEQIQEWNDASSEPYPKQQLEELILRYEPPDERNRWDKPLYRVDLQSPKEFSDGNNRNNNGTNRSAVDALQRSVYNMHNLSGALQESSEAPPTDKPAMTTSETQKGEGLPTKPRRRSTFKRIQKKKPNLVDGSPPAAPPPLFTPENTPSMNKSPKRTAQHAESKPAIRHDQLAAALAKAAQDSDRPEGLLLGEDDVAALPDESIDEDVEFEAQPPPQQLSEDESLSTLASAVNAALTGNNTTKRRSGLPIPPPITPENTPATKRSPKRERAVIPLQALASLQPAQRPLSLNEQIDAILDQFLHHSTKTLEEGMSTRWHVATDANVLQTVDALTQRICFAIQQAATISATPGMTIAVPTRLADSSSDGSDDNTTMWRIPPTVSGNIPPQQLKRIRRQFVQWCKKNPPEKAGEIAQSFLEYLTEALIQSS